MLEKSLASLQHPLIKHWASLRQDKSYRQQTQRLLITGKKQIEELSREFSLLRLISITPSDLSAEEKFLVTAPAFQKMTGLKESDGFAAELALPAPQDLSKKKYLLILDQITDPGNLGTLLRTAYALNWDGVVFTPNTVDPFNDKALRAGKGAIFRLPFAYLLPHEILLLLKKFSPYVADTEGSVLGSSCFTAPLALILSHEAKGPSFKQFPKVTIPMNAKSESLNVAASGAILLHAMRGAL